MSSFLYTSPNTPPLSPSPPVTQQFGVSLIYIRNLNVEMVDLIPPIVRDCVEYLSKPAGLETEGLFRLRANPWIIDNLKSFCNQGDKIHFGKRAELAATLLVDFFHELTEPIFTYKLYYDIIYWDSGFFANRLSNVKSIIHKLPAENYVLLKYLIRFLLKVNERSSVNKMNFEVLAFVFGPNLAWPLFGDRLIEDIVNINNFFAYLLVNFQIVFI